MPRDARPILSVVRHTQNWQGDTLTNWHGETHLKREEKMEQSAQNQEQNQEPENPQATQQAAIDYDKLASILDGRQKSTEESVLKGYFKEQGLTGDEVAQAIQAFKEDRASKEPDVAGLQTQLNELRAAMETANSTARLAKVENAVILEATKMGIDPKAIPYLTRMADLTDIADAKGEVSAEKVSQALAKVLDDLPVLKPQAQQQTGFRVGGEGDKGCSAPKADDAKLKAIFGVK